MNTILYITLLTLSCAVRSLCCRVLGLTELDFAVSEMKTSSGLTSAVRSLDCRVLGLTELDFAALEMKK